MFPMGDFGVVCNFFSRWAINTKNRPYLTFPKFINLHCVCVCVCVCLSVPGVAAAGLLPVWAGVRALARRCGRRPRSHPLCGAHTLTGTAAFTACLNVGTQRPGSPQSCQSLKSPVTLRGPQQGGSEAFLTPNVREPTWKIDGRMERLIKSCCRIIQIRLGFIDPFGMTPSRIKNALLKSGRCFTTNWKQSAAVSLLSWQEGVTVFRKLNTTFYITW